MKALALHWKILLGIVVGILAGLLLPYFPGFSMGNLFSLPDGKTLVIDWIKPFGTIFINLLKLIAIPLIITSLITGVAALLATAQAHALDDARLRRAFAAIADDECRHGQLAFDVHAWLLARLPSDQRAQVEGARAQALSSLPARAAAVAAATPPGLGWPSPRRAAAMAQRFAAALGAIA